MFFEQMEISEWGEAALFPVSKLKALPVILLSTNLGIVVSLDASKDCKKEEEKGH